MDQLAKKAITGDKLAERELFDKLLVRFRYLAKRRVGDNDSEDLAQEACATVFEKYQSQTFTVNFEAWAHGVLKMKIGNYLQSKKRSADRSGEYHEEFGHQGTERGDPDLKRFLTDCMKELLATSKNYTRILNLTYQGYETAEICKSVNISRNNYYVSLSRGRSLLKACLEQKGLTV